MKKILIIVSLIFSLIIMGFVSAEIVDITKVSGAHPFISYYAVSDNLILVYGVEDYKQGSYSGASYYFFVDTNTGERQDIEVASNEARYIEPVITLDYVILRDTLNDEIIFYNIQDREIEFSLSSESLAPSDTNCNISDGQIAVLSDIRFLPLEEGLFYLATSDCQIEEDGTMYGLGTGSWELLSALDSITQKSSLIESFYTPFYAPVTVIDINKNEVYFSFMTDNGEPAYARETYTTLAKRDLLSETSDINLLENLSGIPTFKKDGDLLVFEKLAFDTSGSQIDLDLVGFSYYNLSDGSTGDFDIDLRDIDRSGFTWDFSEGKISWVAVPPFNLKTLFIGDNQIHLYDISSGEETLLDAGHGIKVSPLIQGNNLFWVKVGNNLLSFLLSGTHPTVTIHSIKL